jgi:two-component system cell cycle response regulator
LTASSERAALVLVADDSLVIRKLLRRQLEEHGHDVVEAVDGEDALVQVRAHLPDVVLLDVEMPNLDGHGVLRRMHGTPDLADIPVVFLTARASTEDVVEGLRLGAHDYLRKPFEPSELVARVSAAVRVKRLQDELRERNAELDEISRMDVVTGLPNRRHLLEHLQAETAAARRRDEPFGLLMIDVDHFKKVNDEWGHESGDAVLRIVAARLASACRQEDVAGRWGGEEFVVVAPASDLEGATALAERVRSFVAQSPIPVGASGAITVTVSVGVVTGVDDVDELLRRADEALYEAKQTGRNRVVAAVVAP